MRLVWPYTEELISRPFVGENRFRLVLQAGMGPKNAIGCFFSPPGATFFLPLTCTLLPLLSVHFKWICAEGGHVDLSGKQIHVTCFGTNPFEMHTEQRKQCACKGQTKSCSWWGKKAAYSILGAHTGLEH